MQTRQNGFSLIEVLLGGALLSVLVTALVGVIIYGEQSAAVSGDRNRAAFLNEEGWEAVRNIRDAAFANLTNSTFGLTTTGNQWNLSGSSDTTGNYTRTVTIATATSSANAKDVTTTITWQQTPQRSGTMTSVTRMTDWRSTISSFANPAQQSSVDVTGNQDGIRVAYQSNYAYLIRVSGSTNFHVFDVSNPAVPTLVGSTTLSGTPTGIVVSGNYAYVSSTDNASELQVVDVTTKTAPAQVATLNPTGNADGLGIDIVGSTVYLVRATNANNFVVINVTTPTSPSQTGITSINGNLNSVKVIGTTAYVASANDPEFIAVNVTTPSAPASIGTLDLSGGSNGLTVTAFSGTAFMGRASGDVAIINVTTPATPALTATYASGTQVNDVTLHSDNGILFLAKNSSTSEFEAVTITTLSSPTQLGVLNLAGDLDGVAYDPDHDRVLGAHADNSNEFIIIMPQ